MSQCVTHSEKEESFGSSYVPEVINGDFIRAKTCKATFNISKIHIKNLEPQPRNIFITYEGLDFQHQNVLDILIDKSLKKIDYTSDHFNLKDIFVEFLNQKLSSKNKLRNIEEDRIFIKEISLEEALANCDETLEAHDKKWRESTREEAARIYKIINLEEVDEGDL